MATPPKENTLFAPFSRCVSIERLEAYRRDGDDDLETLTRYLWNIALCEAFYPILQILEIGLRNSIHNAASAYFGDPKWYKAAGLLAPNAENMLTEAERELEGQQKSLDPGRIIAELNFGFWTNLLNRRYEQGPNLSTEQNRLALWPRLLKTAFPTAPAPIRTRHTIAQRFELIRKLRNRVFHYEPILNRNLQNAHDGILDAMGWISPALPQMARVVDRFPMVYHRRYEKLKASLDQMGTPTMVSNNE